MCEYCKVSEMGDVEVEKIGESKKQLLPDVREETMTDFSKNSPKDVFVDEAELRDYAAMWQKLLFLDDWIIVTRLSKPEDMTLSDVAGENEFNIAQRCCVIRILLPEYYGERIVKYCAEKTLVHELLHCKYNWVRPAEGLEGKYFDEMEHGLLEQMAKSLIMARYNVTLDYFKA